MSSGINITDKTHEEMRGIAYDHRIPMKELTERMWTFVKTHKKEFDAEMF